VFNQKEMFNKKRGNMKTTNSNTKRILRNAAIACACVCFPVVMQANPTAFDAIEVTTAEYGEVAQGSATDTYKYEADMGKKQKQNKKRRRHRKISHLR
jgi:hypothetical protein